MKFQITNTTLFRLILIGLVMTLTALNSHAAEMVKGAQKLVELNRRSVPTRSASPTADPRTQATVPEPEPAGAGAASPAPTKPQPVSNALSTPPSFDLRLQVADASGVAWFEEFLRNVPNVIGVEPLVVGANRSWGFQIRGVFPDLAALGDAVDRALRVTMTNGLLVRGVEVVQPPTKNYT